MQADKSGTNGLRGQGTLDFTAILRRSLFSRLLIWERDREVRLFSTLRFNSSVLVFSSGQVARPYSYFCGASCSSGSGLATGRRCRHSLRGWSSRKKTALAPLPAIIAIAQATSGFAPMTFGLMSCPSRACGALRSSSRSRRSCKAPGEKYRPQGYLPSPADATRMIEVTNGTRQSGSPAKPPTSSIGSIAAAAPIAR